MNWNFWALFSTPYFVVAFVSWFLAQFIKIFTSGRIAPRQFFAAGGMPSSHSSTVVGITAVVGILHGFDTAVFMVALVFAGIVMYDAANVRYQSGKHAEVINDLVEYVREHNEFNADELKEIIGHEPLEVLMGAVLGIAVAVVYCAFIL